MDYSLNITENAAKQIAHIIAEDKNTSPDLKLRVTINGGGCSGFQYSFSLDATVNEDDYIFEFGGIKVIADEASLGLIDGSEIDFYQDMMSASFVIKNPNAASGCGCGNSFSI